MQNERNRAYKKMQSWLGSLVNVHNLSSDELVYENALLTDVKYKDDGLNVSYKTGYYYRQKETVCIKILYQEQYLWCVVSRRSVKLIQH
jgi:hypothetical protein